MIKKIISLLMAMLMLLGVIPLSVFASGGSSDGTQTTSEEESLPKVTASSLYYYREVIYDEEYRALPDDSGTFYFDITVDKEPETGEDILVYYRTVDDSAVAEWGDYEAVGVNEEAYVTLNKANNYKARVSVQSKIIESAFINTTIVPTSQGGISKDSDPNDKIVSRKFHFEMTRIEGNAVFLEKEHGWDIDTTFLPCYLKAETYYRYDKKGKPAFVPYRIYSSAIVTPEVKKGSYSDELNIKFDENWKDHMKSGDYQLGIAIYGDCYENFWNSDGPVTLDIYYTYNGEKKKALSLYMEGEWDDSTFFGWEYAYDYIEDDYEYDYVYDLDIEDYMEDNFIGFTLYDNDENVVFEVKMDDDRGTSDIFEVGQKLRQAVIDGYSVTGANPGECWRVDRDLLKEDLHYLALPSNFIFADSYSYTFSSNTNKDPRWLERGTVAFRLTGKNKPKIVEENKVQMVSTNIESLKIGDPLNLAIRFDNHVYVNNPENCYITADINGQHAVRLNLKLNWALDTLVFEGELPESVKDIKITSLRNITLHGAAIYSYLVDLEIYSTKIDDIYGYDSDLRVPYATVSDKESSGWMKSKPLDIYVYAEGTSARFNDYTTVYYQWSNSSELPTTYDKKQVFHTESDGEVMKTIIGTGNGETYLHIKTVSRYGKSSISDKLTITYDPSDPTAVYTPFGPYKFDNAPPLFTEDDITITGSLKEQTISLEMPNEDNGIGLDYMSLYYVPHDSEDGEGVLLKKITASDFSGDPKTAKYTISHSQVGVGVDEKGNVVSDRKEIDFYWILADRLGNVSEKTAAFSMVFDTNDYLEDEIISAGPYDYLKNSGDAQFESVSEKIDDLTYIYDYSTNKGKNFGTHGPSGNKVYFGFSFKIDHSKFGSVDNGEYSVVVKYKGEQIENYAFEYIEEDGLYAIWLYDNAPSGRYDLQLVRKEGDSSRVSQIYSVYATDGKNDETTVKGQIEAGTLLTNEVYQLSTQYPYFYYKDSEGVRQQEYYNNTKAPASFSSYAKAKAYVYFMELSDISLVKLNATLAQALNSGTTGFLKANGETKTAQADQYWIRYKSEAWTPTSGDSSWVYYYYGMSGELSEGALSLNLQNALNAVSNRIVGYGKTVILTDTSLFLDSAMGDKMLNGYGMPSLLEGQIHYADEMATVTKCGDEWSIPIPYAGDKGIYRSDIYIGEEGSEDYMECPLVGSFEVPENSRFQYMTYSEYVSKLTDWRPLALRDGETFVDVFSASGTYYIREMSTDGVSVFPIYIDKEAPTVSFSKIDDNGELEDIPVDGIDIVEIRAKEIIIGRISDAEYDRLSYVAIYKVSNLALVDIYTAEDLDSETVKLTDGNYYIVVSDRSGNHYTITAKVSSTDLNCEIKESANRFIRLTCNRRSDQILRYEVYLNGTLVTSTYSEDQTFDSAGLYTIYVQDIYGNVFSREHTFKRDYPEVTWKYLGADGKYYTYNSESPSTDGFIMTWVSDNKYKISTAVKTRFSFNGNYSYEFIGTAPKYNETVAAETVVTIDEGQSFTLKIYYKNYPENSIIYSGVVDVIPPTVSVSAEVDTPSNGEHSLIEQWIAEGNVGDVIKVEELYYSVYKKANRTVVNGGSISSDFIKINVMDANDLSLVEVYLDGTLFKKQDAKTGFSQIVVSRWGSYRIVAKDTLGNSTEFTFTNGIADYFDYFVDGVEREFDLHGYLNFKTVDGKMVYGKVDYGNTDFKLDVRRNSDVFISVGVSGGETEIYGFRISDGCVYPLTYSIVLDELGNKMVELLVGTALINTADSTFLAKKEYLLNENGPYAIYASVSSDKVVSFRVYAPNEQSEVVSVNARLEFGGSDTMFVSSEISKKCSHVTLRNPENNEVLGAQSVTDVRVSNGFTVDETTFVSERISSISLYYSELNDLDPSALEGRTNIYASNASYTEDGFYLLIVRNKYGNETVYRIGISSSFAVTASVTFGDGYKIHYSKEHSDKLYSNHEIAIDILDEGVNYKITRNGVAYENVVVKEDGEIIYLIFSEDGVYEVTLTDSYGNVITKQLEINKTSCSVGDDLLMGYNEKALKRDEGYTNQKLSIDKTVYDRDGLYYLAISYNDTLTVLFDAFSEVTAEADAESLIEAIGAMGDGVYTVICRNRYGAIVTKEIHYRGTPTLKLERTTRSKTEPEIYELERAMSVGFWSNNTLMFSTAANTYVFKINGDSTECPRVLAFNSTGELGSSEYEITYIDEYGFEYTFKAYLERKTIGVNIADNVDCTEIDGVINTKNDVSVIFDNNCYATYTRNNGEEIAYKSGDLLKRDGTYRFTVTDIAGNVSVLTVRKDTVVEFSFIETSTTTAILNGGVVNSSKVSFDILNGDNAYIEKVLKDGVLQEELGGTKFTEDGKWEVIVSDKLGNKAYFCFYIITHSKNGLSYTTPYEYRITEVWYESKDGEKISYMNFVNHSEYNSSFDFIENGKYTVVMVSDVTGNTSKFEFTINTTAPDVSLIGCNVGETTINDVTLSGCKVGDRIKIYRMTKSGEELVEEILVTSVATKMPIINEGGEYRIVVESEAGVSTELSFVRKHVMNTSGSVFIMIVIGISVVGLFTGLVYRNKSKTDD